MDVFTTFRHSLRGCNFLSSRVSAQRCVKDPRQTEGMLNRGGMKAAQTIHMQVAARQHGLPAKQFPTELYFRYRIKNEILIDSAQEFYEST